MPPNSNYWTLINKWSSGVRYLPGSYVVFSDVVYRCNTAHISEFGQDRNGDIDLVGKWVTIEHSDEIPQNLKIILNAKGGRFMTKGIKPKKYDRIYYEFTDHTGKVSKDVYHIKIIKRERLPARGKAIVLYCAHQSENLWKQTVSYPGRKNSGDQALKAIVGILNENRGTQDPTVEIPEPFDTETKTGSRLSIASANDYIFESVKLKQAFDKIAEFELQPPEGGGRFEAMYLRFVSAYDHATNTNLDKVFIQAFEQGYTKNGTGFTNKPKVTLVWDTIESGNRPTVLDLSTNELPPKATNIIAIGHKNSGTYPTDFQKYASAKEVFDTARDWSSSITYDKGNLVIAPDGNTYESKTNNNKNNQTSSLTHWIQRTFTKPLVWNTSRFYNTDVIIQFHGIAYKSLQSHTSTTANAPPNNQYWIRIFWAPTTDYSPLTKNSRQDWINFMPGAKYADNTNTDNRRVQVIDKNCIIKDVNHPRDPVRYIGVSPNQIPAQHRLPGNKIPNAYKMLVMRRNTNNGTGTDDGIDDFAGNDPHGVPFAGNIAEYRDPNEDGTGTWYVFAETKTDYEIVDWDEAESWIKNPVNGLLNTITNNGHLGAQRFTTWKRGAYQTFFPLINQTGGIVEFAADRNFECFHPIRFVNPGNGLQVLQAGIAANDTAGVSGVSVEFEPEGGRTGSHDHGYYAGLNFWSLWPLTSNNHPTRSTPTVGSKIKLSLFDFFNMFKTHENKTEWFGPQSEDYYPIQSFSFLQKFRLLKFIVGDILPEENFNFEMWFADARHNVVTIDYNHHRNNITFEQDLSLSQMKPYFGIPGASVSFRGQEPEVINVFQPREWQFGGIQTKDSFDDQGRYIGSVPTSRFFFFTSMILTIDAFRMKKPLVATNADEPTAKPTRNIETSRQTFDEIISYFQLKNLVLGLSKLYAFERKEITHKRKARNDLQFGDPVYTKDTQAFSENDDGLANTILGVVNRIVTTHSKPKNGPGGSSQTVDIVTRLFPDQSGGTT